GWAAGVLARGTVGGRPRGRSGHVPARRADALRRMDPVPGANGRLRARSPRLRALGQAGALRLPDRGLYEVPRALPRSDRAGALQPGGARLGRGRTRARPAPAGAGGAPGGDEHGSLPARLPLAPYRAVVAHPGAGGADHGRIDANDAEDLLARVQREAGT